MKTYFRIHLNSLKINIFFSFFIYIHILLVNWWFIDETVLTINQFFIKLYGFNYFIYTEIFSFFLIKIYLCLSFTTFLSLFILILQYWVFLSDGFYKYENHLYTKFYLYSCTYTLGVFNFCTNFIFPGVWVFLTKFNPPSDNLFFEPQYILTIKFFVQTFMHVYFAGIILFIFFKTVLNYPLKLLLQKKNQFRFILVLVSSILSPPDFINYFCIISFLVSLFELLCIIKITRLNYIRKNPIIYL